MTPAAIDASASADADADASSIDARADLADARAEDSGDGEDTLVLPDSGEAEDAGEPPDAGEPIDAGPPPCPTFNTGTVAGMLSGDALREVSGLAASRLNPGVLWAHNDSGAEAELIALDSTGQQLGIYSLTGASHVDWEDLAIGPGPMPNVDYLYIADAGDNDLDRSFIIVYRVPEPTITGPGNFFLDGAEPLRANYPGDARDAEAILVDPLEGDIYLATKDDSGTSEIFVFPKPHLPNVNVSLVHVIDVVITAPEAMVTGGAVSPSGDLLALKTKSNAYVWRRTTTVADAFTKKPCDLPLLSEPQGEAISFSADGQGYFTLSEDDMGNQPLHYFQRL